MRQHFQPCSARSRSARTAERLSAAHRVVGSEVLGGRFRWEGELAPHWPGQSSGDLPTTWANRLYPTREAVPGSSDDEVTHRTDHEKKAECIADEARHTDHHST